MPIPAPKSLDDVFDILNECFNSGRKLWDMDRHRIRAQLQEALAVQPVTALVYSGMLATLDNDESSMRANFRRARTYGIKFIFVNFNYAISLMKFGHYDEASEIFTLCLENGIMSPQDLDELACAARELSNPELSEKILRHADKLNIGTKNLRLLAMDMLLGMADSPEEESEILETFFPDEVLKKDAIQLTDEEWEEMQNFAEELKQYL